MSWRIKMKARKAPQGMSVITPKLEEFETRTREALNAPPDDKRRNEISWPIHKLHYEKNRYLYEMRRGHEISKQLLDYLIKEKIADGKLIAKWRRPGYERLCSLSVITKSNMNFGGVGVCRIPLKQRRGQIMPNVLTGCVSCASGDGGPIWWDDPVPDIVKQRIVEIDPGKAEILDKEGDAEQPKDDDDNQHEGGGAEGGGAEGGDAQDGNATKPVGAGEATEETVL